MSDGPELIPFVCIVVFAEFEEVVEFLEEVIASLLADQEVRTFGEVMVPVFDIFQGRVKDLDLCQLLLYSYLEILLYFSRQKDISKVCMQCLVMPMLSHAVFFSYRSATFLDNNFLIIGFNGAQSAQRS